MKVAVVEAGTRSEQSPSREGGSTTSIRESPPPSIIFVNKLVDLLGELVALEVARQTFEMEGVESGDCARSVHRVQKVQHDWKHVGLFIRKVNPAHAVLLLLNGRRTEDGREVVAARTSRKNTPVNVIVLSGRRPVCSRKGSSH